jgi:DNA-directed RNA polymerase
MVKVPSRLFQVLAQKDVLTLLPQPTTHTKTNLFSLKLAKVNSKLIQLNKLKTRQNCTECLALIFANIETENFNQAERIFHRAIRLNRQLFTEMIDVRIIHKFINAFLSTFKDTLDPLMEKRALEWLNNMERDCNISPSIHTYAMFISHFLHSGQQDKAKEMVDQIIKRKLQLSKLLLNSYFADSEEQNLLKTFLADIGKLDDIQFLPEESLLLSAFQDTKSYNHKVVSQNDYYNEEEWKEIKALKLARIASTDSDSVAILRKCLNDFSSFTTTDKYNQQTYIESRSYSSAVEQGELLQSKLPKEFKSQAMVPKETLTKWFEDLTLLIKRTVYSTNQNGKSGSDGESGADGQSGSDGESGADVERRAHNGLKDDPLLPFMKLISPEQMAKITISQFMQKQNFRDNKSTAPPGYRNAFGCISALLVTKGIGESIQREYNLTRLSSPARRKELKISKGVHNLQASGKLYNLALRKLVSDFSNRDGKEITCWRFFSNNNSPNWGVKIFIQLGSFLSELLLKVATISVRKTDLDNPEIYKIVEIPAITHKVIFDSSANKRSGLFELDPAMYDLLSTNPVNISPWCLPMVVPPLPWITWKSGGYLQRIFLLF